MATWSDRSDWLDMLHAYRRMDRAEQEAVEHIAWGGDPSEVAWAYFESAMEFVDRYAPEVTQDSEDEKWRELAESIRLDAQE